MGEEPGIMEKLAKGAAQTDANNLEEAIGDNRGATKTDPGNQAKLQREVECGIARLNFLAGGTYVPRAFRPDSPEGVSTSTNNRIRKVLESLPAA